METGAARKVFSQKLVLGLVPLSPFLPVFDIFLILCTNMQGKVRGSKVWGKSPAGTLRVALDTDMSLLTSDGQVGYCMRSVRTRPEITVPC